VAVAAPPTCPPKLTVQALTARGTCETLARLFRVRPPTQLRIHGLGLPVAVHAQLGDVPAALATAAAVMAWEVAPADTYLHTLIEDATYRAAALQLHAGCAEARARVQTRQYRER
jgi:hypothetical protein